jgi:uncharacterized Fe-S radical SAM superfamily protein PflX
MEKYTPKKDALIEESLARYFAIVKNRKRAKFLLAKEVEADFEDTDSLDALWQQHTQCTERFQYLESQADADATLSSAVQFKK